MTVSVTGNSGSGTYATFPIDAPPVQHASIAGTAGRTSNGSHEWEKAGTARGDGRSRWTARLSPESVARPGQPLELALNTSALHFFDPVSGDTIGARAAAAVTSG